MEQPTQPLPTIPPPKPRPSGDRKTRIIKLAAIIGGLLVVVLGAFYFSMTTVERRGAISGLLRLMPFKSVRCGTFDYQYGVAWTPSQEIQQKEFDCENAGCKIERYNLPSRPSSGIDIDADVAGFHCVPK